MYVLRTRLLLLLNILVLLDETRDHSLSMRGKASSKNHADTLCATAKTKADSLDSPQSRQRCKQAQQPRSQMQRPPKVILLDPSLQQLSNLSINTTLTLQRHTPPNLNQPADPRHHHKLGRWQRRQHQNCSTPVQLSRGAITVVCKVTVCSDCDGGNGHDGRTAFVEDLVEEGCRDGRGKVVEVRDHILRECGVVAAEEEGAGD